MTHPRAGANPAVILALVCVPVFIGALDLTVISAILPQVVFDLQIPLRTGLDDAAWVVSGYLLAYTIAMTFIGRLSDLWGRRRIYLGSLVIFALGSLLVAAAQGIPAQWLGRLYRLLTDHRPDPSQMALWAIIAGRVVQALGGGALVPVSMALVGDLYPPGQRAGPLGFVGAVDTAGWVVGHLYGGIIVRFFDWQVIFWLNLPICALAFILLLLAFRAQPPADPQGRFDWPGTLLAALALTGLSLALGGTGEATLSASSPPAISWPLLVVSLGLLVLFIAVELRQTHPILPLKLLPQPNFGPACLANFIIGFCLIIAITNVPLFINALVAGTLQQGAWDSGWMLSGLTVPMAVASLAGGWLTARLGPRWTAGLGLLTTAVGFGLMSQWVAATPYPVMLIHLLFAGIGFGLVISPIATAVVNAAGQTQRGSASALVIILRLMGMTVGLSWLTTYDLSRVEALANTLLPTGTTDLNQLALVGMQVTNQAISETFLIASGVCLLALGPVLFLRRETVAEAQTFIP